MDVLRWVGARSVRIPEEFSLHSTLKRGHVDARLNKLLAGTNLDWSTAESLAMASLLYQGTTIEVVRLPKEQFNSFFIFYYISLLGYDVRISGQDVGRGTFSQRHCMLVDQKSNEIYIPLNDLGTEGNQGHLEVWSTRLTVKKLTVTLILILRLLTVSYRKKLFWHLNTVWKVL